jgi:hypothetical protein
MTQLTDALLVVVPQGRWAFWDSTRMRGRPAQHAVLPRQPKTLCGRSCEGWEISGRQGSDGVTCKLCLRVMKRMEEA